jgi:hypothetical protein
LRIPGKFSPRFGDVHEPALSTDSRRRAPRGCHELRAETGFRLVSIQSERDITPVVRLVGDASMIAVVFERSRGIGLFSRENSDAVDDFGRRLPPVRFAIARSRVVRWRAARNTCRTLDQLNRHSTKFSAAVVSMVRIS